MKWRRTISLGLAAAMTASTVLAGCGGDSGANGNAGSFPEEDCPLLACPVFFRVSNRDEPGNVENEKKIRHEFVIRKNSAAGT